MNTKYFTVTIHSLPPARGEWQSCGRSALLPPALTVSRSVLNLSAHQQQQNWAALPQCRADRALLATGGETAASSTSRLMGLSN